MKTALENPKLTLLLFAAMVDKLGGEVVLTQDDVDRVAYNRLEEDMKEGVLTVRLVKRITT